MKMSLCIFFLFVSAFSLAKEFCELQPEGFDGSRRAILDFEENIENEISKIYQAQYPLVIQNLRNLQKLQEELTEFEAWHQYKYVKTPPKHPRSPFVDFSRKRKRKEVFLKLAEQNFSSQIELNKYLEEINMVRPISFEDYRAYADQAGEFKDQIQELQSSLLDIQSFGFLHLPEFNLSFRGSRFYGNFKVEGLFRMPKDDLLKLPFLQIGFETKPNTVIYSCIHLDELEPDKNRIYIYFLNTTKMHDFHWKDIFLDSRLAFHHILRFRQEPKAVISPLPFVLNPLSAASETLNTLGQFQQLNSLPAFNQIMSAVGQFDFLNFSANIHPILSIIKNNVQVGIKGFMIQPDRLQIRYAGTTLYGLINFNLAVHNQRADFSSFMNMMTLGDL